MNIFILVRDSLGVQTLEGYTFDEEEANERAIDPIIYYTESIDYSRVKDDKIFIGERYHRATDYMQYVGLFYSHEEGKKVCGERSTVLSISLPKSIAV